MVLCALPFAPVVAVVDVARERATVAAAADRVRLLIDEPAQVADVDAAPITGVEPSLTLQDVRFRYGPGLPDALSDVSFEVRPAETVALVGHSGADKSTCAHLALRLWDAARGCWPVDTTSASCRHRSCDGRSPTCRRTFTCSTRPSPRTSGRGAPSATDDEVEATARQALTADFVDAPIMVLDKAVSDLDTESERELRMAMARAGTAARSW